MFSALAVVIGAACSDAAGPGIHQVTLGFSGVRPTGVAPAVRGWLLASVAHAPGDSLVISDGTNTLIITRVEVVARDIELRRAAAADCDSTGDDDACEELELDARLITLPLLEGVTATIGVDIPEGTYSSIELDIHKPGNDAIDNAFLAANPGWPANTSIRVTGFYNGTPFTYTTDVDFEAEESFNPALVVDAGGSVAMTVRIDVSIWFRNGPTGPLINPATAGPGGANQSLVENNIQNSVKAFEDDDQDGDERDG